jgi:hypothetical protein
MGLDIEIGIWWNAIYTKEKHLFKSQPSCKLIMDSIYKALNTQNSMLGHVPCLTFILFQYT